MKKLYFVYFNTPVVKHDGGSTIGIFDCNINSIHHMRLPLILKKFTKPFCERYLQL